MENSRQNTTNYVGAAIIALLLIGIIFTTVSISKGKKNLKAEKLTSEKLLSEKLSFEKELARLQAEFSALKLKSDENQKLLTETNNKISEYEKRINSITGEVRSLRASKKELEDLKKLKADLEKESARLKSDYDKLLAQNKDLQNSISSLESEKKKLAADLENTLKMQTDNFLVTTTRGKTTEKLVNKATRVKKLNMTFEVPKKLTETVSFKIITPSGTTVTPDDKAMSWTFPVDSRNFTASLSAATGEFEESRQVVFNYAPKTKLTSGEYKIQILSNGITIGNCRVRLK